MNNKAIVVPGERYGRLEILNEVERSKDGRRQVLCRCDCGNEKIVRLDHVTVGRTKSCGCIKRDKSGRLKHGLSSYPGHYNRIYKIWSCMRQRCNNPNYNYSYRYGGRGIRVCSEWDNDFLSFREWALNNGYSDDLTLDRIDVNGNYEPSNCRWADAKQQANNRRNNVVITYHGETHTASEWSDITGIDSYKIRDRLRKGLPLEQVFFYGDLRLLR